LEINQGYTTMHGQPIIKKNVNLPIDNWCPKFRGSIVVSCGHWPFDDENPTVSKRRATSLRVLRVSCPGRMHSSTAPLCWPVQIRVGLARTNRHCSKE